jgi:hypothetical protein
LLDSTQVVDFPHLARVRLFWEGLKFVFSHGWNADKTQMQGSRIYKEGRNGGKQEKKEGLTTDGHECRKGTIYKEIMKAGKRTGIADVSGECVPCCAVWGA